MQISELAVLLPCHSLEDFPLYYDGDEAEELLTAWTTLWHPALVAACCKMPRWHRADFPPDESQGRVYLVPSVSRRLLAAGWPARAEEEGGLVVAARPSRGDTLAELLERCGMNPGSQAALVDDFFALGYGYLQTELLTRQMRYVSSLDEPYFETQLVTAAKAAIQQEADRAAQHLKNCFHVLMEARDRFYPVDSYLLDLTLTADAFLGPELEATLRSGHPLSVHMTGRVVETLAHANPDLLGILNEALAAGTVCVAGGEYEETDLPLLSLPAIAENLNRGRQAYHQRLGSPVRVFLRRRFGLSPALPMLLSRAGFIGCVHCTFDDGVFPAIGKCKTRWQGFDGSAIDAFGRVPLDASRPETFLSLCQKVAEAMDLDHVATVAFVHWPGKLSPWFSDFARVCEYAPIFGKFLTLDDYFQHTDSPGRIDKFEADDYRSPYLRQSVRRGQRDPLSTLLEQAAGDLRARITHSVTTFSRLLADRDAPASENLDRLGESEISRATRELARRTTTACQNATERVFAFNPFAHDVQAPGIVEIDPSRALAPAKVPAFGFAWSLPLAEVPTPPDRKPPRPIAIDNVLANEHMEVVIDPNTGAVRSIRDLRHRGNRLSQQLALRLPASDRADDESWRDAEPCYTVMAAERLEASNESPIVGDVTSRGRLLNEAGQPQGEFQQRVRLLRGSRVLVMDLHVQPGVELPPDPWNAYYACRFAWADESAQLYRSVHATSQRTSLKRFEAPHFVEIREDKRRTAILTGGLPFHRRSSYRMLDTLLIVRGETRRNFRIGIGLDLPCIAGSAEEFILSEIPTVNVAASSPLFKSGWLFHVDSKSVISVDWSPIEVDGQNVGFRARFLETQGQAGRATLRAFRPVAAATQVDDLGGPLTSLSVSSDGIVLDFSAYELVNVEAHWAPRVSR